MAETEDVTYRINPEVDVDKYIIDCYELFGKVIGKAIFERIPLQFYLDRPLIKRILNKEVTIQDMYYFDKEVRQSDNSLLFSSLSGMLERGDRAINQSTSACAASLRPDLFAQVNYFTFPRNQAVQHIQLHSEGTDQGRGVHR